MNPVLCAWWWKKQGLDGSLSGKSAADVLSHSGWARSVGGSAPYLTIFSRAGLSREVVDADVAAQRIHELPSVRGCTYVLPASDFALGLRVSPVDAADMRTAIKLGVTEREVEKLCESVMDALATGPLDPEELKQATGGAARRLGPEGAKKGISSTMPLALGRLQVSGDIRRIPTNGRLDQQRYRYALWKPNPLASFGLSVEEAQIELARRYFRWIGPATLGEYQWFSGLGVKASMAVLDHLKLETVDDDGRQLLPDEVDAFRSYQAPKEPQYALVCSIDAMLLLRRDLKSLTGTTGLPVLGGLMDLPNHAILDRGRIVGLWEFDPATSSIAWRVFGKKDAAVQAAVSMTERYIQDQLGDVRSFSLDSPKSRAPRIEVLRNTES